MYYTDEARISAINAIRDCISKIGEIPGNHLSYLDARKTSSFLNMLIDEIKKESKAQNEKTAAQKIGKYIVIWEATRIDDNDEEVIVACFKDARNAAKYASREKGIYGVHMRLYDPKWKFTTLD